MAKSYSSYSKRVIKTSNGCLSLIFIILLSISAATAIGCFALVLFQREDTHETVEKTDSTETLAISGTKDVAETPETDDGNGIGYGIIAGILMLALCWLWFQCWRIVRQNTKKELAQYRMLRDTIRPNAITRKHLFRSHEYFISANEITDILINLGKHLSGWPDFMEIFNHSDACNKLSPQTSGNDAVLYKMRTDLIRCYIGLGHNLDFQKPEILPLVLFILKSQHPTPKIRWWNYRKLINKNRTDIERNLAPSVQEAKSLSGFLFTHWLRQFENGLYGKYIVSLYRFASLVAKADRKISPEEIEWLKCLGNIRESQDESLPSIPSGCTADDPEEKAILQLEHLVGLDRVKAEITTLANYIQVQKLRAEQGLKVSPVSYHCVFTGNPGTGKTTVARLVAGIYRDLGVLRKGHLVETDRSGLIAEYVGQTAVKTNKLIDSALDGVLFIDEAYSLVDGGSHDYGKEAIATLLKRMEDNRDRLVVIIAGYTEDMKRFIHSNPGLESRFNRYIEFPDYSVEELMQIFELQTKQYEYQLEDEARMVLKEILCTAVADKNDHFGNGRFVRNLFEKVVECQANRMAAEPTVSKESLGTIRATDILTAAGR